MGKSMAFATVKRHVARYHPEKIPAPVTPALSDASGFRVNIAPSVANGLHITPRAMADKPATVRRARVLVR